MYASGGGRILRVGRTWSDKHGAVFRGIFFLSLRMHVRSSPQHVHVFFKQDYRTLEEWQMLDKHETCYHDYVSCHIKVHGLTDAKATTWTRKLKEYIELM